MFIEDEFEMKGKVKSKPQGYVGVDVGRDSLVVAVRNAPNEMVRRTFANTRAGQHALIKALKQFNTQMVVVEASGGYERGILSMLTTSQVKCGLVNPRQTHNFAQSLAAQTVKTDAMDAAMLARFAQERIDTIKPYQLPSETQQEMTALATRIVQVQKDMVADKARLSTAHKSIKNSLESSIAHFEREVDKLKARLIALLKRCPETAAKAALLDSVPGVGIHTAAMLLATLPELGTLNRQQIAKLAGLAPIQDQSGNRDGKARIAGGRSLVRKVLFMATLTADRHEPVIAAFYNRILERKGEFKIAHVAAMRKLITILNAIIKTGKPWEDRTAKSP